MTGQCLCFRTTDNLKDDHTSKVHCAAVSEITTLFSCAVEKPSVIYFCCTCQGRRERFVLVQDNGGRPWPFEGSVCHKYLWAGPDMTQPDRFAYQAQLSTQCASHVEISGEGDITKGLNPEIRSPASQYIYTHWSQFVWTTVLVFIFILQRGWIPLSNICPALQEKS